MPKLTPTKAVPTASTTAMSTLTSKLQTIAPLGIIAATLISIALINQSEPISLSDTKHNNHIHGENNICIGKPGAQVTLTGALKQSVTLLEEKQLNIKLATKMKTGYLSVTVKADEGLELTSEQTTWLFELTPSSELTLPISIYANHYGSHYLNVFTQYTSETGRKTSRALAMEFSVAEQHAELFKSFTQSKSLSSTNVISLPSKETIF